MFRLTDENRDHLRRWLPWLDRTRVRAATTAFIEFTLSAAETGTGLHCAIEEHGRIVGVCGYNHVDGANPSAQIGYWLDACRIAISPAPPWPRGAASGSRV